MQYPAGMIVVLAHGSKVGVYWIETTQDYISVGMDSTERRKSAKRKSARKHKSNNTILEDKATDTASELSSSNTGVKEYQI